MNWKLRSKTISAIEILFILKTCLARLILVEHGEYPMCEDDMDCFKSCLEGYGTGSFSTCENGRCEACQTLSFDFEDYKKDRRMMRACEDAAECFLLCRQEYGSAPETDCVDGFCTPCYSPAFIVVS